MLTGGVRSYSYVITFPKYVLGLSTVFYGSLSFSYFFPIHVILFSLNES